MTVEFIESELGVVDVATILADPARFDHQSCFDPVEGRDYGRTNAMFFAEGASSTPSPMGAANSSYAPSRRSPRQQETRVRRSLALASKND